MRFQKPQAEEPEVVITPLIDVVFLLLIFFMISTTFERETEVRVELPEASGQELQTEEKVVEITIDAQGNYYVNRQALINTQLETLKRAIQNAAGSGGEVQVILSADRKTPHEAVITAMDAARRAGLFNMTFATRKPDEER